MEVLWVDDDSPPGSKVIAGTTVVTAQTLDAAERMIAERKVNPEWVIVDLIIPQAGWNSEYLLTPGVDYIRHLSESHPGGFKLAVFSIALTSDRVRRARAAGAQVVVDKHTSSLVDVLDQLRELTNSSATQRGEDV